MTSSPISHCGQASPVDLAGTLTRCMSVWAFSTVALKGVYHSLTVGSYLRLPASMASSRRSRSAVKSMSTISAKCSRSSPSTVLPSSVG